MSAMLPWAPNPPSLSMLPWAPTPPLQSPYEKSKSLPAQLSALTEDGFTGPKGSNCGPIPEYQGHTGMAGCPFLPTKCVFICLSAKNLVMPLKPWKQTEGQTGDAVP